MTAVHDTEACTARLNGVLGRFGLAGNRYEVIQKEHGKDRVYHNSDSDDSRVRCEVIFVTKENNRACCPASAVVIAIERFGLGRQKPR